MKEGTDRHTVGLARLDFWEMIFNNGEILLMTGFQQKAKDNLQKPNLEDFMCDTFHRETNA